MLDDAFYRGFTEEMETLQKEGSPLALLRYLPAAYKWGKGLLGAKKAVDVATMAAKVAPTVAKVAPAATQAVTTAAPAAAKAPGIFGRVKSMFTRAPKPAAVPSAPAMPDPAKAAATTGTPSSTPEPAKKPGFFPDTGGMGSYMAMNALMQPRPPKYKSPYLTGSPQ